MTDSVYSGNKKVSEKLTKLKHPKVLILRPSIAQSHANMFAFPLIGKIINFLKHNLQKLVPIFYWRDIRMSSGYLKIVTMVCPSLLVSTER